MVSFIQRLSKGLDRISRVIVVSLFVVAFLGVLYSVFSRFVLQSSSLSAMFPGVDFSIANFTWMEELIRYSFVWVVFLGVGIVYKEKGHAHVELLMNYLPKRFKKKFEVIIEVINLLFFSLLLYKVASMMLITNGQLSPSLKINMMWMYVSILCCSAICIFHSLSGLASLLALQTTEERKDDQPFHREDTIVKQAQSGGAV
jgi:TRAP-type C4-dicarboxylate transport system permease small subunit